MQNRVAFSLSSSELNICSTTAAIAATHRRKLNDKTTPPKKGKNHGLGSMLLIQYDDSLLGLGSMPFGISLLLVVIIVWFLLLPHGYQQQPSW
ncbi:hypothetical protein HanXRQr2_Chr14g0631441 [Helianthus annuus]|uniref:Transmembrane protein n=1 Tax=Helianthus annuus TaxID=4232 RepID=A0A9K3E6R3_HELAN|nr:hypothetical protein HanXRQr2_Chr14g0631441 [Helianthus annuus]KAJ0839341.1 hypothetical protein HanPSC8_Chr14g0605681 [Helianthus annuus]